MKDVLLVVDALNDFRHDEGDRLLASFRSRAGALRRALEDARGNGVPVVYVNDNYGDWSGDRASLLERARGGRGGDLIAGIAPRNTEPLLFKARYSAFDHTALPLLLRELGAERLLLAGGSTEGCIVQTGIDARELGLKVTILADACATVDEEREQIALRYAESVAGMFVDDGTGQRRRHAATSATSAAASTR
jgi:nicotinamidase-related amidase